MTPLQLASAAFWDQKVCLTCEATNDPDAEECECCGSSDLLPAETIERAVALVREEE